MLIAAGAFEGSIDEVVKVSSSRKRTAVLMDFLERQMQGDLKSDQASRPDAPNKVTLKPTDNQGDSDAARC